MFRRTLSAAVVAAVLALPVTGGPAFADNQMGYRLLPAAEASALPRKGGSIGINVGPAQQIDSSGLTFRVLKVNSVTPGSPGAKGGLKAGDQIIALDGRVFPNVPAFASYVASVEPGKAVSVDYMPSGGGPQDAQRLSVTLGGPKGAAAGAPAPVPAPAPPAEEPAGGLTTGQKVAIGLGAVALFGCYKFGCFSKLQNRLKGGQPAPAR